jgi:PIN domain nuclease of toxin-antitoxin system
VRLLLDTHVLLWSAFEPGRLSLAAREALVEPENELVVSAATAWEIATKHRLGRLQHATIFAEDFENAVAERDFAILPITARHGRLAGSLPGEHGDPFDRMLAAQARAETLVLVSNDRLLDQFGVQRLW